jgi:hypothetical protein
VLRVGAALFDFVQNDFDHTIEIFPHLIIPEPQNDIAFSFYCSITPLIARGIFLKAVLAAVEFDSNATTMFGEIEKIPAHRNLAAEMIAARVKRAKLPPE